MDVGGVLKKVRGSDYGASKEKEEPSTVRSIKLSDDEQKALEQIEDGATVQCDVTAKKEGDHLHVMSVAYSGGSERSEMDEMAQKVAGMPS